MSKYRFFSFLAFLLALGVGGALVAMAGKPGAVTGGPVFTAELQPDTMGLRPVESEASGRLTMELSADGATLVYQLEVVALEDAFMSHLQYGGPEDRYGPIVVWLFPEDGKRREVVEGRFDGVLAQGEIRAQDLQGPLAGQELAALLQAIEEGMIFADVHTRRHVPGELRGHVRPVQP
ncbi:CHRD domain-containing protein [Desulfurivibrio alkaliphilus]|uniref:CHRD domain containing protein n=1 Tax=Desulfurivibrio alkaliphilus (strain DSM 19089 / UNIQEM U267 / AHT2) TaxID=589865 RepID=D6Z6U7_DESAT|nr:CHRD domain-containing protein [Desulfurivibrio alkaliphilus]ADH86934.1 CHRD domain containing protein [Desulfurivibrio alkaliphilus AHT 2]